MAQANRVVLGGRIVELDVLRHTPGGVPLLRFRLSHESSLDEAGSERKVDCEIAGVAFEREAKLLASARLGSAVTVTGFLAARSRTSRQPVLHATHIEFTEGE